MQKTVFLYIFLMNNTFLTHVSSVQQQSKQKSDSNSVDDVEDDKLPAPGFNYSTGSIIV